MTSSFSTSREEIARAWCLWNALNKYAEVLWDRYEGSFLTLLQEEQNALSACICQLEEDDIPF